LENGSRKWLVYIGLYGLDCPTLQYRLSTP
jgi:hypothetical protein